MGRAHTGLGLLFLAVANVSLGLEGAWAQMVTRTPSVARGPEAQCKLSYQQLVASIKRGLPPPSATPTQCFSAIEAIIRSAPVPHADCLRANRALLSNDLAVILRDPAIVVGLDRNGTLREAYWEVLRAKTRALSHACAVLHSNTMAASIAARIR